MAEARRRCELIASTQYGLITRGQALAEGLSERAIARLLSGGSWSLVQPGVYAINGAPGSWLRDVMAAVLSGGSDTAASHRTAAALWECPGFPQDIVEVTSLRALRRRGVTTHRTTRLDRAEIRRRESIAVTDPERTLINLGAVVDRDSVEVALDYFLAKRLTTLERIDDRLEKLNGPGWRGTKKVRALVDMREPHDGCGESPLETKLFQVLRKGRIPLPERQVVIRDGNRFVGRVDFAYPQIRLIVEAQSYKHHSSRKAWTRDVMRRRELHLLGWRVLEVTWHDVTIGREDFLRKLRKLLGKASLFD